MKKELKQIYCPLCRFEKSKIIFTHARLANIRRTYASRESVKKFMTNLNTELCRNCGFLYRKPLMEDEKLRRYYTSSYVETFKPKVNKQNKDDDEPYNAKLLKKKINYRKYFDFLARKGIDLKGKRILDVGCGTGWFLALMNEYIPLYRLGIEPSKQRCKEIENRKEFDFRVLNGVVRDFSPDELGTFDLITLIGVLEHVSDPIADLKTCRSFMSKDSYIYIYTANETPNLFIDMKKRISLVHQLYFTPRTIRVLFEKVGLKIVDLKTIYTEMYILAKKYKPFDSSYKFNRIQHNLLKTRYMLSKNIPSSFFSISSWFYLKYLAVRDRLSNMRIINKNI